MKTYLITSCIALCVFSIHKTQAQEPDYLKIMDESLYAEYANMKMEMYKNDQLLRHYEMEYYRQEDKMRMEFTSPATEKGRRMLNDNSSLWMYLPRTSKVIKLPFKQSFMGTDASNTDLMRISFQKDYEIAQISTKDNVQIELTLKAKDLEVAYDQVIIVFDINKQVPVKQEMYSLSGKLIKTIYYEEPIQINKKYFPSILIIKEELQKNTQTKLIYSNIKKNNSKSTEFFTLGSLKR